MNAKTNLKERKSPPHSCSGFMGPYHQLKRSHISIQRQYCLSCSSLFWFRTDICLDQIPTKHHGSTITTRCAGQSSGHSSGSTTLLPSISLVWPIGTIIHTLLHHISFSNIRFRFKLIFKFLVLALLWWKAFGRIRVVFGDFFTWECGELVSQQRSSRQKWMYVNVLYYIITLLHYITKCITLS